MICKHCGTEHKITYRSGGQLRRRCQLGLGGFNSASSKTFEEKLSTYLGMPLTPCILAAIRSTVREEQQRLISEGVGDTAEEFWIMYRMNEAIRIVDLDGLRALHREQRCPGRLAHILPASYALLELREIGWMSA